MVLKGQAVAPLSATKRKPFYVPAKSAFEYSSTDIFARGVIKWNWWNHNIWLPGFASNRISRTKRITTLRCALMDLLKAFTFHFVYFPIPENRLQRSAHNTHDIVSGYGWQWCAYLMMDECKVKSLPRIRPHHQLRW